MNTNDITGDKLITDISTDKYKDGWELIWSKKKTETPYSKWTYKEDIVINPELINMREILHAVNNMDPVTVKPKYAPELTEKFIGSFTRVPDE